MKLLMPAIVSNERFFIVTNNNNIKNNHVTLTEEKTMLVSKSNEINTSTFINSGNCNERKSSKSMELLAYSIIKLICKEAASGTYNGALEILQKMMSECKYHEGNAFVIMGAGEQLKRIKYDANENKLKVYNVHFDNNQELVADGEPDVVF